MKLLASDFDGTLYFHDQDNPYKKVDIDAIKDFQKAGNKIGVCTGRPLVGITDFASTEFDLDFYITSSGACVYDKNQNALLENVVNYDSMLKAFELYPDVRHIVMTKEAVYIRNGSFDDKGLKRECTFDTNDEIKDLRIFGFSFHFETEEEARIAKNTINQFEGTSAYQNKNDVDCVREGCSKSTGIRFLMNHLKIDESSVACIGDSYNDLPMLTAFENSYTFDYAPVSVQQQSKYIVENLAGAIEELMK